MYKLKILVTTLFIFLVGCSDDPGALEGSRKVDAETLKIAEVAKEKAATAEEYCTSTIHAFYEAETLITKQLVSPSTADFASVFASVFGDGVRMQYIGNCTHEIWSFVDSQNSFGGIVRTNYYVKMKYNKETNYWGLLDIRI